MVERMRMAGGKARSTMSGMDEPRGAGLAQARSRRGPMRGTSGSVEVNTSLTHL